MMSNCKYIPYEIKETIFDIDYKKYYDMNIKYIIFDVDNTIVPYSIFNPDDKIKELFNNIKNIGFTPIVLSNNHSNRISMISNSLGIDYICNARKPFKKGYNKVFKKFGDFDSSNYLAIGDQIVTDIYGATRFGIKSILVKPIHLNEERWYTRFNRFIEKFLIKKLKRIDYNVYKEICNLRGINE